MKREVGDDDHPTAKRLETNARTRHKCYILDISGSMAGGRLNACKASVREDIEHSLAPTVYTLVSFSDIVTVHEATTRDAVLNQLDALCADGLTALFQAVGNGIDAVLAKLEPAASDLVVTVLTDGADNCDDDGSFEAGTKDKVKGLLEEGGQLLLLQPMARAVVTPGVKRPVSERLGIPAATALAFTNDVQHMRVALNAARSVSEDYFAAQAACPIGRGLARPPIGFSALQRSDSIDSTFTHPNAISRNPTIDRLPGADLPIPMRRVHAAPMLSRSDSFASL